MNKLTTLFLLAGLMTHGVAQGANDTAFFGATVGFNQISNGIGGGFAYGLNGGYYFSPLWGTGLFVRTSSAEHGVTVMEWGLEFLYRFRNIAPGLTLGLDVGEAKFSGAQFDGNYGLMGGGKAYYEFLIPTAAPITFGVEGGMQWSKPGSSTLSIMHGLATVKYWF